MPSGNGHLVTAHEVHNHHQQASFMEDPCCPSLFSISNPQHQKHDMFSQPYQFSHNQNQFHETQVEEAAAFCSLNFKLGLNENSSSSVGGADLNPCEGFGNLILRHDVPEARPNSLDVPISQQGSEPIKERFWKPVNRCNVVGEEKNGGKHCYKFGPQEEERHDNNISLDEKYRLFSELEAIYSLPNVPAAANQAGSALTGEITSPSPSSNSNIGFLRANNVDATGGDATTVPAAANAPIGVDHGSEISIGGEEAALLRKKMLKRKKKMKEQLGFVVGFFECLVKQVMEHQEGLHRKFMEAIERMDKGRTKRETAWRRQEAEKRNREAMSRAHDQALVVQYIEKITGQSIDFPARTTTTQLVSEQADDISKESNKVVDTSSRWPKAEVEALIGARSRLEPKFQEPGLKGPLWEEVSSAMASMGYQRSAKRCKEKWENINKYFRKIKDSANSKLPKMKKNKSCEPSKTCSYFDQLDQLYSRTGNGLNNGDPCSLTGLDEAQRRGGYSELLAYIVAQNPNTNANLNASNSDCEANLDEEVEGKDQNEDG